jgi:hypothetical protein
LYQQSSVSICTCVLAHLAGDARAGGISERRQLAVVKLY